jgi:autoinducer 2 (AI-2) kinase
MGLDFGGGGARCLLVHPESGQVHTAFRAWSIESDPADPACSSIDVERSWALLGEATREALDRAGTTSDRILGLAASSVRHGSVVLDADGAELLATWNRDVRGLAAILELAAQHGGELHRRTGHWPHPVLPAGRLRWMATQDPEAWARAATHLSVSDWVAYRLCGVIASEASQAGETLLFDLEARDWAWDLVDRLEVPRGLLPEIRDAGSRLGVLSDTGAAVLGLRAGTPVAVGGADTQCGLLGAGVVASGQLGAIAGTSAPVQQLLDHPGLDADAKLWGVHHVIPGLWALESNGGAMGTALDWIGGLLYPGAEHPVLELLAEAAKSRVGAAGILSTVGAEVMDARQPRLPVGEITLSYLTAADDPSRRRHLARAVLEGMAFATRANVEQVLVASAAEPPALRLAGGLSRSAFFTQLLSDVSGRTVEVSATPEASALGAAICAGVGAGVFRDLAEGADGLARVARRHQPEPQRAAAYQDLYRGWQELRASRAPSEAAAAGLLMRALASSSAPAAAAEREAFRPRILVAAAMDEVGLEALRQIGEVEHHSFRTAMRLLTGPALVEALEGIHVFVTEVDVVDAAALVGSHDLRVVAVCRGDAVNVDLEACTALGIPVLNTPGRNANAVADLTLAFLLMLARRLPEATAFLRQSECEAGDMGRMGQAFSHLQGSELWRKTVGMVGLGAVGHKVVQRLRPFGVRCLACDPHLDPDQVRLAGAEPVPLDELLGASDFVTLHAAVTDASRGLIGARELALMRPGSFLVNTARAALVDEAALTESLRSGHLGGAALDVFYVEPPGSDHPLLAMPNVIATPHVGGNTAEVAAHQGRILGEDLERLRRGEAPHHLLNPETLEHFSWSRPRPRPSAELVERLQRGPAPAVTDLEKEAGAPRAPAPHAPGPPSRAAPRSQAAPGVGEIAAKMERLLRAFVERIASDQSLREFARGSQDVTLHFTLSDLGLEFHFGFRGGAVTGALGPPSAIAEVQLKMKADLLDGMFTERRNAMQAAMDGELSFSGDTAKAMTLTHIQNDLNRLYGAAREEIGGPGDLSSIPDPGDRGAAAAGTAAPAGSDDLRRQLIEVVDGLYTAQLITATGGNASLRTEAENEAWITPSQLFKGDLSPEVLVRIDLEGRALDPQARSPSSEALMHTAVLSARADVRAVLHCHAPYATILANAGLPFLPISTEAAFLANIGRIPFIMPGTRELADAVVEAMGDGWAVLMQNHGLLVAGRSLRRAADICQVLERTCEVIIGCHAVGKQPPTLPDEIVEMLSRYGDLMA